MVPYRANMLPGVWRWWYNFGCGDIGNDGVHDIDVALWGLGVQTHPQRATCIGTKSYFDDDQQFPDTQYAIFEYGSDGSSTGRPRQLIFEQRIWSPYRQEGYENGAAFYGTNGYMLVGHTTGWRLYGPKDELMEEHHGIVELEPHHSNFFDCIRGTSLQLNADVMAGHRASTIVHLANIAARVGGDVLQFDGATEQILHNERANAMVRRTYREGHWAVPEDV